MANRDPEPESRRVQLSPDYIQKHNTTHDAEVRKLETQFTVIKTTPSEPKKEEKPKSTLVEPVKVSHEDKVTTQVEELQRGKTK